MKRVVECEYGRRDLDRFPSEIREAILAAPLRKDGWFDGRYRVAHAAYEAWEQAAAIIQGDFMNARA